MVCGKGVVSVRQVYLITGGLGQLGREIVPRLLAQDPAAELVLLVRARDHATLASRAGDLGRYLDTYWPGLDRTRVRVHRGDVTAFRLGLDDASYRLLTSRVTHIIHAAACIDLGQSLGDARRVNVGGAREVLGFADRCTRLRRLAHVSTAFVAGDREGTILERELRQGQGFRNAYEQSKCEAEELMQARMADLPVSIFRPSVIVGDSRDGHTCNFSMFYRALRMIARGRIRELPVDPEDRLDVVTVDYVADAIVEMTMRPRRWSAVYHLTAGPHRQLRIADLLVAILTASRGGALRQPVLHGAAPRAAVSLFFDYIGSVKTFDDATTRVDLGPDGPWPVGPETYLSKILAFCVETRWGRSLPWEERQCQPAA